MKITKTKLMYTLLVTMGLVLVGAVGTNLVINGTYCNGIRCDDLENLITTPTPYKLGTGATADSGMTIVRNTSSSPANWLFQNIARWDVQSSTQGTCVTFDKRIPRGPLANGSCMAGLKWVGDGNGYSVRVEDGSGNIIAETPLDYASGYTNAWTQGFTCHATNSERVVKLCRTGTGTGETIGVGEVFYGKYDVKLTTVVTEWQNYTPVVSGLGSGSYSIVRANWRRVGNSAEIFVSVNKDGTNGSGSTGLRFTLPNNLSIDTSFTSLGKGTSWYNTGSQTFSSFSYPASSTSIGMRNAATITDVVGSTILAAANFGFNITVPIQGWSAGAQLADQFGGEDIVLSVFHPSLPYPGTTPNNLVFNTKTLDTVDGYNTSTGVYTVKSSRLYRLSASIIFGHSGSVNQYISPAFFRNGTVLTNCIGVDLLQGLGVPLRSRTGECEVYLNAGDQITLRINGTNLTSPAVNTNGYSSMTIKGTGPSSYAIPMSPVVVIANNTSGQSINDNSYTTVTNWTEERDTNSLFNATTGIFTSNEAALYFAECRSTFANSNWPADSYMFNTIVSSNGQSSLGTEVTPAVTSKRVGSQTSKLFYLNQGDTLYCQVYNGSGTTKTLHTSNGTNHFTIYKVK